MNLLPDEFQSYGLAVALKQVYALLEAPPKEKQVEGRVIEPEVKLCECGHFDLGPNETKCWHCAAEAEDELTARFGHLDDNN